MMLISLMDDHACRRLEGLTRWLMNVLITGCRLQDLRGGRGVDGHQPGVEVRGVLRLQQRRVGHHPSRPAPRRQVPRLCRHHVRVRVTHAASCIYCIRPRRRHLHAVMTKLESVFWRGFGVLFLCSSRCKTIGVSVFGERIISSYWTAATSYVIISRCPRSSL